MTSDNATPVLNISSIALQTDIDVNNEIVTPFNEFITISPNLNASAILGAGTNTVVAATGNDTITTGSGRNLVFLGKGASSVALLGTDTIVGGVGAATVSAQAGSDVV